MNKGIQNKCRNLDFKEILLLQWNSFNSNEAKGKQSLPPPNKAISKVLLPDSSTHITLTPTQFYF